MAVFEPFKGYRPRIEYVEQIASKPYDVLNSAEARVEAAGNDISFLRVVKSEISLPEGTDPYDASVYQAARDNLDRLIDLGKLIQDDSDCFYIYRQIMDGRVQTGIVGCCAVKDYQNDVIKKHEHTRADKEADRIRHVDTTNANTGPVFLTYRGQEKINRLIEGWTTDRKPIYDFKSDDDVCHTMWIVDDIKVLRDLVGAFSKIKNLYVADGHHRSASAAKVGQQRRDNNPDHSGNEEYNRFLAVCFPSEELHIMDYNRIVKDFNGRTKDEFLQALQASFIVDKKSARGNPYRPETPASFGLYTDGEWYKITARLEVIPGNDPVEKLDVAILQKQLLSSLMGIEDPRTDKRIDFVGGIRGLGELEKRVDEQGWAFAISMFPTSIDDLMSVADANKVMPPKSTWFEPKLRSGMIVHRLV
jgi:uncharacterized protein (DUF1015 family)